MNRKELSQTIIGSINSKSSKKEVENHLNNAFDKLKSSSIEFSTHSILDVKAKYNTFNFNTNDDLASTINELVKGDFYTSLTHLEDLVLRHYKYNDELTPFEIYVYGSVIHSMITSIKQIT